MRHFSQTLRICLRQFDFPLLVLVLATTGFGLLVLRGSTHDVAGLEGLARRQGLWWAVSLGIFFLALMFPYRWLRYLGWFFYALCLVSLLLLHVSTDGFITAVSSHGAASWLRIRLAGLTVNFQPSEFAKIAVVIALAQWLAWRQAKLDRFRECIVPIALMIVPMTIVFLQPDFGTAAVFVPLPFILLFVAGLRWRIVIAGTVTALVLGGAGIFYLATAENIPGLRAYQRMRIRVFLEPLTKGLRPFRPPGIEEILYGNGAPGATRSPKDAAKKVGAAEWNIKQAEMALGGGRGMGKGWGKGTQSRLRFLPQHHTDFVFSSLGEQFGFAGCLTLIALYILIAARALHIAIIVPDPFGKYLVVGLLSIVLLHVYLNIGMSIRLLPVTGLPLPLVSYGGSFLASNYLIFGLISGIGMRRSPRGFAEPPPGRRLLFRLGAGLR